MRVLVLPKWYPWPDQPLFGLFCREHARAAARHHDVVMLAFRPEPMRGRALFRLWEDRDEPLRTMRLAYRRPALRPLAMATQLVGMVAALRRLRREGWRPDVIHAHVYQAGFPAVLLGRWLGCPVMVSEHFTAFQRGLVRGAERRLARFAFERADLVCPVSEDLRAQLEAVAPEARFRVVGNVVDTERFRPAGDGSAGARDPARLLNVASLDAKKGHDDLLDALALLRDRGRECTLEIVGEGELRSALERRAAELGLGERVRLLGPRSPEAVAELMRAADLFVLPSRFENLPVVALEALASGLPVVASAVGGVPEIVDDAVGLTVPSGDPAALAQAIATVLERRAAYDPRALAARTRERYGLDAIARAWDEVYAELVAGDTPSAGRT